MKRRLAIVGAGGHGCVVLDTARDGTQWEIWGFVDDQPALHSTQVMGACVHGPVALLAQSGLPIDEVVVAIGDNAARCTLAEELRQSGRRLATIVHPSAIVSPLASLGEGTVVFAGAIVQPGATLGANAIVNTSATVDHHCTIGDGVHLAPGVHLAGHVTVGARTFVGIGAVAIPGVTIGEDCVIGAGSVVVRDIPSGSVAFGCPATVRRTLR